MRFSDISGVKINENATLVRVSDGKESRTIWVNRADAEKAKALAIKKFRQRVGLSRMQATNDHELTAEIVRSAAQMPGETE